MSEIAVFFQSVTLPVISEVGQALIRTLNNEDATSDEVATIVAKDPALTARLLRMANSASFGLSRTVSTLDDAISLVGMARVRTLCLAACMGDAFPEVEGLKRSVVWRSCMVSAGYAQWISAHLGMDGSQGWLCSMMVRLGEVIIAQAKPSTLAEIERLPYAPGVRWERETRLAGFSEGEVTAELARRWNFPAEIVRGLQTSADPLAAKPFSRLGGIVHLAMLLADMPPGGIEMLDKLPPDVIATLQLTPEWMQANFPDPASFVDVT